MILISQKDADFMIGCLALSTELKEVLRSSAARRVSLNEIQADELRDLCGDRLQTHGFDENYQVTEEGRQLETLIDKLFIG